MKYQEKKQGGQRWSKEQKGAIDIPSFATDLTSFNLEGAYGDRSFRIELDKDEAIHIFQQLQCAFDQQKEKPQKSISKPDKLEQIRQWAQLAATYLAAAKATAELGQDPTRALEEIDEALKMIFGEIFDD